MPPQQRIGITLGDPRGIGPEVIEKALHSRKLNRKFEYVIIGNPKPKRRQDAVHWVVEGAERCLMGDLAALVTAPITKTLLIKAGYNFPGQTELLGHLCKSKKVAMMLVGGPLRVSLVTTHAPLKDVPHLITSAKINDVIELTVEACRRFDCAQPKIGVAGLNPHAGESGLFGDEEKRIIAPAVRRAARKGWDVSGPWPADTLFHKAYRGSFDAVVAMYHDQGLVPLKMVAFESGVNVTLGLPLIRTSPDHGTAPDIAGRGIADPTSMIAAINLVTQLVQR